MKKKILCILLLSIVQLGFTQCKKDKKPVATEKTENEQILSEAETSSLKSAAIDPLDIERMVKAITANEYPNIHSVLIAKDKKVVFEKYFRGNDQKFYKP